MQVLRAQPRWRRKPFRRHLGGCGLTKSLQSDRPLVKEALARILRGCGVVYSIRLAADVMRSGDSYFADFGRKFLFRAPSQ